MKNEKVLNTIEEAIEDFRQGKIVIVVDDEDRENEGDFIIAAEKVTPEIVNFMLKNGRGVLCAPLSEERCAQLELNMMEPNNTSLLGTPFTVTVDLLGEGCTTGVSIHDRAATLRALADPKTKPSDLGRPGHINPLRARQKGVLRRPGHTEAAVDLARLAGLQPAGALIEIMNESFSDLGSVGTLETNEDPMPYVHKLMQGQENTISGQLTVSTFGGGTANTELEFLTGTADIESALPQLLVGDVQLVLYTCGSSGAHAYTRTAHGFAPCRKVRAVDTTGAGDGFIGSFLWQLERDGVTRNKLEKLSRARLCEYLAFSNQFCGISVQQHGAIDSYPTLDQMQ